MRYFEAIPSHATPDGYQPGAPRKGTPAGPYFEAVDVGLHGDPPEFIPGQLVVPAHLEHFAGEPTSRRAKAVFSLEELAEVLGLPGRPTAMYVTENPPRLYVGIEHPDLDPVPFDCEAPIVHHVSRRFIHSVVQHDYTLDGRTLA